MAKLVSVNVGMPKDVAWQARTVRTGIWKRPVTGPVRARRLNVDGDGQGDRNGHGGEQRAVLVYQLDSYRYWQRHFGRTDFEHGQFGENFTVDGLADDEVCIGDRYRIGEAEFEVTQPRVTCFRVGMRLGEPELPALLVAHHRPGFYLRVIREGAVQAGDDIVRTRVGPHAMTVARIDALLYLPGRDVEQLRAAIDIAALSPGWQQSFHELLAGAGTPTVGVEPGWQGFRPLRVVAVDPETPTVTSVHLVPADGGPLSVPRAGQYLTVRIKTGDGPALVRTYSLSSRPAADAYRISVKQEEHGAVSRYVNAQLRPGMVLDAAAPRGEFVLADGPEPVLLISAGIGVTPVLAMLHQLAAEGSTREVWWIHVARCTTEHPFAGEARQLLRSLPNAREHAFHTAADAGAAATTHHGRSTRQSLAALGLPTSVTAYVCGPAGFMTDMTQALTGLGIAADHVHTELFAARAAINPGVVGAPTPAPHQPAGTPGTGPHVTFARSGLSTRWSDRHRTLLELAEACDIPTRWSCRTGVCHTCITPVVSGDVTYASAPLESPAEGSALLCCSRPGEDLVLDL